MPWWAAAPAIVAEALVAVPDPLLTVLRPGPPATGAAVAASLARSLLPAEDPEPAPPWLLPEQKRSFRRVIAAIRQHHGAMLADPVGSGKTYVALAVAAALNREAPVACLVPAVLIHKWEITAARVGVQLILGSHEQVSRGLLPERSRGLVIVDESHHFRNRHTKRYVHLASWLVGRPALLVTATPIVNRLSDLGHQLHLAVRDNALAFDGILSLRALLASGCARPALGQLIVEDAVVDRGRPSRVPKTSTPPNAECGEATRMVESLRVLRLSRARTIATLVRGVLLRAVASSPAALAGTLRRYRRLLLHARDAQESGRAMDRSELRRFTAELGDQLIWWELLPSNDAETDLELSDLASLDDLIVRAATAGERDPKLGRLRDLLVDGKPTLVFTSSRDTVHYIRERLDGFQLAWCTGERAGLGGNPLPRQVVLEWFREGHAPAGGWPRHLVVTDVAAEGLDLQRAARVVHYDLPWTPMRLDQREGRAVRLGSRHSEVEVVRFTPPPPLERALHLEATLAQKARLPAAAGLGDRGRHIWRWRIELADSFNQKEGVAGVASVSSSDRGLLAGFALYSSSDPTRCLGAAVGWIDPEGGWTDTADFIAARLTHAAEQRQTFQTGNERLRDGLALLTPIIRDRFALIRGRRWVSSDPAPSARRVTARLNDLIQDAARRRQADRLLRLDQSLAFVAGGHTAGEAMLIERLAEAPATELEAALMRLRTTRIEWDGLEVRVTGLIFLVPPSPA